MPADRSEFRGPQLLSAGLDGLQDSFLIVGQPEFAEDRQALLHVGNRLPIVTHRLVSVAELEQAERLMTSHEMIPEDRESRRERFRCLPIAAQAYWASPSMPSQPALSTVTPSLRCNSPA